ncbi:MAG: amidohydrolase family protein [Cyclobacteriaceae bacterium]|nr:amidohydrolase family protein [Cyclobacteriaceae bacterium]
MDRIKIDMHTHIFPKHLPRFSEKFGYDGFIHLEHHRTGFARMMQGDKFFREIEENCWNPELRIEEYEKLGVQTQVVCTIPVMFCYDAKPEHGLEIARFLNDDLSETTHKYPKRYIGLGTLPMQDTKLAIQELERCKNELGFKGIQIGSNVNNENLNEEKFFPIFEACQDLGMAVLVHPWNMMGKEYMEKYWLPWLVGMPAETSRAVCSMIFGGVFERLPQLRVNFAHAGGSFLPTIGRVEHGYNSRPDLVAIDNPVNPRKYLGKFWVDCITHDPTMLEYVLKTVGDDKVTLGSDYPFPLGDLEIGKFIDDMNLEHEVKDNIYCHATLQWLDIKLDDIRL